LFGISRKNREDSTMDLGIASRRAAAVAMLVLLASRGASAAEGAGDPEDITLTRALELGRARSAVLAGAIARAQSAGAAVSEQEAAYVPSLHASLSGAVAVNREAQPLPPPDEGLFVFGTRTEAGTGSAGLQWTLFDFGRTAAAVAAASDHHRSARATARQTELAVDRDVAVAYVDLYYAERLRDAVQTTFAQREALRAIAAGLVRAGLQPDVETARAAARAEAARVELANAETEVADARVLLASMLSLDPQVELRPAPPRIVAADADVQRALREAEGLPEVQAADAARAAGDETVSLARRRFFPSLGLDVEGSYQVTRYLGQGSVVDTRGASATAVVSLPIFDWSSFARLSGAEADARAVAAVAEQARRDARRDAARAAYRVRATAGAVEHARAAAASAADVLGVVEARYQRGLSSPLDVIDAESADAEARISLTRAERARALAEVDLLASTGRAIEEAAR
jgi:outer membrane protein TolC